MEKICERCGWKEAVAKQGAQVHVLMDGRELSVKEFTANLCKDCVYLLRIRLPDDSALQQYVIVVEPAELSAKLIGPKGDVVTITIMPLVRQMLGMC